MDPSSPDPPEHEEPRPELGRFPVPSMRTKWAILIVALWVFSGAVYMGAYDEILSSLANLENPGSVGPQINATGGEPQSGTEKVDPYVTLFVDDFEGDSPYRNCLSASEDMAMGQTPPRPTGSESASIRDGSIFLNLTKGSPPVESSFLHLNYFEADPPSRMREFRFRPDTYQWLHSSVEFRLRYADVGLGETGVGEGMRAWGLADGFFCSSVLEFETWSDQSDPSLAGLWVQSDSNYTNHMNVNLDSAGIDLSEWHTYTIAWEPGNATFFVDSMKVATTNRVPSIPLGLGIYVENMRRRENQGKFWEIAGADVITLPGNISLQIDYVRVFVRREVFKEMDSEISLLVSEANDLIGEMEAGGEDTAEFKVSLADATTYWRENNYVYLNARRLLEGLIADMLTHRDMSTGAQ